MKCMNLRLTLYASEVNVRYVFALHACVRDLRKVLQIQRSCLIPVERYFSVYTEICL